MTAHVQTSAEVDPMLAAAVRAHAKWDRRSDRDCCVFVRDTFIERFGLDVVQRVATYRWHLNPGTGEAVGPWEPVLAAVDAGIADIVEGPIDGYWHVAQAWRGTPFGKHVTGHTFFWNAVAGGVGAVLHSSQDRGMRLEGLTGWAEFTSQFPAAAGGGVVLAALRQVPRKVPQLGVRTGGSR